MPAWYVYILNCADNTLYTGIATDVERRLQEHNSDNKTGAKYTRARRPVTLVYQEQCISRSEAAKREYQIKQLDRRAKEALIHKSATL
jgi:putative endonuclease